MVRSGEARLGGFGSGLVWRGLARFGAVRLGEVRFGCCGVAC